MYLISDVLSQARYLLQDARTPYRHDDDELLAYFNNAIGEAYRLRPDLFLAADFVITKYDSGNLSDPFPVAEFLVPQFVAYVAGFAELSDDEFATDGRAIALVNKFTANLLSTA